MASKMQLVERHIFKNRDDLQSACEKSKVLYNQVLYYVRQMQFGKIQWCSEFELMALMVKHNDEYFRLLPNNISQQTIKSAYGAIRSFHKASKEYKNNPGKFTGKPQLPRYKKLLAPCYITYTNFRLKSGYIHFVRNIIKPIKTKIIDGKSIKQVRIIPQATCFIVELVYEKGINELSLNKDSFLSIDLGVNNLATCLSNVGPPFIVNGKIIKSFNQWFNKRRSLYQSFIGAKGRSNKINNLLHYRNCWVDDKMHKASKYIIDYCKKHNIGRVIIGKNEMWKNGINIGRVNNQIFVNIPHANLIHKIKYKAELAGILVETTEESYTSKIDHFALEKMARQVSYLGKRIKRGLFQSSTGKVINADINGALGIARKVIGDSSVNLITNSGVGLTPYRINIL